MRDQVQLCNATYLYQKGIKTFSNIYARVSTSLELQYKRVKFQHNCDSSNLQSMIELMQKTDLVLNDLRTNLRNATVNGSSSFIQHKGYKLNNNCDSKV